jgi:thymidylate synthase, flavin-dependent
MIEKGFTIDLPPHGYVRYIDHMGDDTRIVEAARVSYGAGSKGEEADKKLLKYLFTHRHTSPFEQGIVAFNIKMPVFVMRQLVRHRTFRLNEFSGRYSEMPDQFYVPEVWRIQNTKNKQGSLPPRVMDSHEMAEWQELCTKVLEDSYADAYDAYNSLLKYGVAKEMARFVLPVGIYTEIYMNVDLHNLMHFFNLRTDSHAQKEIRDVAWAMVQITENLFPWSIDLWSRYGMAVVSGGKGGDAAQT